LFIAVVFLLIKVMIINFFIKPVIS